MSYFIKQIIQRHGRGNRGVDRYILGDGSHLVLPQLHEKPSQMDIHAGSALAEPVISIRKHGGSLHAEEILHGWTFGCHASIKGPQV